MAIKGKSIIELYNSNTKVKEKYVNENIVTNALSILFNQNYKAGTNSMFSNLLPLYKKALGGIILFDNTIEENVNTVIAPNTVGCTGYASNDTYGSSDLNRGSMNSAETKLLDNGMQLVFDFATSQANGDIGCISLTSAEGGKIGYGSKSYYTNESKALFNKYHNTQTFIETMSYRRRTFCIDDYSYQIYASSTTQLVIKKGLHSHKNISLCGDYTQVSKSETITLDLTNSLTTSDNDLNAFYDNGYFYVYRVVDTSTINMVKISIEDFTFTEFQITSNALFSTSSGYDFTGRVALRDGYFYVLGTTFNKVYKYAESDPTTLVKTITLSRTASYGNIWHDGHGYIIVGGIAIIDGNDEERHLQASLSNLITNVSYYHYKCGCGNDLDSGLIYYMPYYTYASGAGVPYRYYEGLAYRTNYLATINNLDSVVTKTAQKVMKVTYTLTEE